MAACLVDLPGTQHAAWRQISVSALYMAVDVNVAAPMPQLQQQQQEQKPESQQLLATSSSDNRQLQETIDRQGQQAAGSRQKVEANWEPDSKWRATIVADTLTTTTTTRGRWRWRAGASWGAIGDMAQCLVC